MSYEITPRDFCSIVENPKCQGQEKENGKAKEGHESCNHCKGNYFVGGECNYGGRHTMERDLQAINQNFRAFDVLVSKQAKLSSSKSKKEFNDNQNKLIKSFQNLKSKCEDESGGGFFYGSCIGLDGSKTQFAEQIKETFKRLAKELNFYMEQVKIATWTQLRKFQINLAKLNQLNKESTQLAKEWKEEQDPAKKAKLFSLLSQKNNEIVNLQKSLKKDPNFFLFSEEKREELADIVKNIFQGNNNFFDWTNAKKKTEEKPYLGIIPKKVGKITLYALGGIIIILFVYWIIKKFKSE